MDALEKNIRKTIRDMKRKGTLGASLSCLRQNTPASGLTLVIERGKSLADAYRETFAATAHKVAADMDFEILGDQLGGVRPSAEG